MMGGKKPAPEPLPMGTPTHRLSTNESARPVPYLAGKQRLGLAFISDIFSQRADAVSSNLGKQSTTSGYNYYASFMTLIGGGPFDALHDLLYNGDSVYTENTPIYAAQLTFDAMSGLATFRTQNPHGRTTGEILVIRGAVEGDYNGAATITVTDTTHFTYPVIGTPTSPATGTIYALVQLDAVERGSEAEVNILVPDFGPLILQWGTEDQVTPAKLTASGTTHPNYRGIGCIFFDQTFLGFNQTNVQNLEGVFARFPQQDWLVLDPIEDECNPIAFIVDMLQNPRMGLRIPTAKIDTATMAATAAQLAAEGLGFSPLILRQQKARQIIQEALEYIDGYLTLNASGQLGVKLARGPVDDLPVITDADLTARAEFAPEDWSTVKTGVTVKFTDRDVGYNLNASRPYRDASALSIKGEPDVQIIDRLWFTRKEVADAYAVTLGRMLALPALTGRLKLRQRGTLFTDLLPGALFKLDLSTRDLPYTIFRVTDRILQNPARPEFEISFRVDRSYLHPAVPTTALPPLTGIVAWYKADESGFNDTEDVTTWPDLSGNANHLLPNSTAAVQDNSGAFPVVRWDGSLADFYYNSAVLGYLYAGIDARTIVAVFQSDLDTRTTPIAGEYDAGISYFSLMQSLDKVAVLDEADEVDSPTAFSTDPLWAIASYDGTTLKIQTADGSSTQIKAINTVGSFVAAGYGVDKFQGSIAEIMVYDHALDADERTAVVAYLEDKYSL